MTHDYIGTVPQHGSNDGEAAVTCRTAEQINGPHTTFDDLCVVEEKAGEDDVIDSLEPAIHITIERKE
jgi:hypothetical protein